MARLMQTNLKVDLSDDQMKISESTKVPLSSRVGINIALSKAQARTHNTDCTVAFSKSAASMK
jgi:hypothetical protein